MNEVVLIPLSPGGSDRIPLSTEPVAQGGECSMDRRNLEQMKAYEEVSGHDYVDYL